MNLALAALVAFVVWGRVAIVPIAPFSDEDAHPVATAWDRAPVAGSAASRISGRISTPERRSA